MKHMARANYMSLSKKEKRNDEDGERDEEKVTENCVDWPSFHVIVLKKFCRSCVVLFFTFKYEEVVTKKKTVSSVFFCSPFQKDTQGHNLEIVIYRLRGNLAELKGIGRLTFMNYLNLIMEHLQ